MPLPTGAGPAGPASERTRETESWILEYSFDAGHVLPCNIHAPLLTTNLNFKMCPSNLLEYMFCDAMAGQALRRNGWCGRQTLLPVTVAYCLNQTHLCKAMRTHDPHMNLQCA